MSDLPFDVVEHAGELEQVGIGGWRWAEQVVRDEPRVDPAALGHLANAHRLWHTFERT